MSLLATMGIVFLIWEMTKINSDLLLMVLPAQKSITFPLDLFLMLAGTRMSPHTIPTLIIQSPPLLGVVVGAAF